VLTIALSVYRNDLKTIKKEYKNSSILIDMGDAMIVRKGILLVTIKVLNSGFSCNP